MERWNFNSKKNKKRRKFAFLIHPRISAKEDMGKVHFLFKIFPEKILRWGIKHLSPFIGGEVILRKNNKSLGWIIVVPLVGKDFFSLKRDFVINKIIEAIKKAKSLGAEIVGLGEFIASVTHGGRDLVGKVENIFLTNGNSLTAGSVIKAIEKIKKIREIDLTKEKIAVVGGGGSVGRGVSLFLAEKKIPLIIIEKNEKIEELKKVFSSFPFVEISDQLSLIKEAKIVIVTTSSTEQIIKPEYLRKEAIVYDITQPRNTSPEILKARKDIIIIDGGVFDTPEIDYGMDIGLKRHQAYACLIETMICAFEGLKENYVGYASIERIRKMLTFMEKYQNHFKLNIFQSFKRSLNNKLKMT